MREGFTFENVFLPRIISVSFFLYNYITFLAWKFLFPNAYINANHPFVLLGRKKRFPHLDSNPRRSDHRTWNLTIEMMSYSEELTSTTDWLTTPAGSTDSHSELRIQDCSCFLLEITQFAHQKTCFTGHVIYSWIILDAMICAGRVFFSHSPLRSEDRSAHGLASFVLRESHLIGYS